MTIASRVIPAIPGADFGGRIGVPSYTSNSTAPFPSPQPQKESSMSEKPTHRLPLVMPIEIYEAVKELATADRRPVSTYIIRLIEADIEAKKP